MAVRATRDSLRVIIVNLSICQSVCAIKFAVIGPKRFRLIPAAKRQFNLNRRAQPHCRHRVSIPADLLVQRNGANAAPVSSDHRPAKARTNASTPPGLLRRIELFRLSDRQTVPAGGSNAFAEIFSTSAERPDLSAAEPAGPDQPVNCEAGRNEMSINGSIQHQ